MKHSLEDLSARSRRGELSEAEQRQLRVALDASVEAGLAHRAGLEFDAEDSVLAGDDKLAQRVTERLLQNQPVAKRRGRGIWRFAAAGVCLTVAAAAGTPVVERAGKFIVSFYGGPTSSRAIEAPAEPAKVLPPAKAVAKPANPTPAPEEPVEEPELEPDSATSPPAPPKARAKRASESPEAEVELAESAAARLFREASRLRREGQSGAAMERYRTLLSRFPSSSEARASEIALGMLHLGAGSPAAGLQYFERYLSANPGGQQAADALWGKTQALAALGRSDEARRGLELLIERYPRSTYATAARTKLGISP